MASRISRLCCVVANVAMVLLFFVILSFATIYAHNHSRVSMRFLESVALSVFLIAWVLIGRRGRSSWKTGIIVSTIIFVVTIIENGGVRAFMRSISQTDFPSFLLFVFAMFLGMLLDRILLRIPPCFSCVNSDDNEDKCGEV